MSLKSTNYFNTFIEVAEDCPVEEAMEPPRRGGKQTATTIQHALIANHPYEFTSDDVIFEVFALKNEILPEERAEAREAFFAKGQPCLRASPLGKRYGWGVHSDAEGKVAIYARESEDYARLANDETLQQLKAMRSKRA
jgi:hypothetical protein